jgi:hypothetical protein
MSGLSSRGIFLSYRHEDTAPYARLLQFQLRDRIPDTQVFMDLDSIEPGLDFAEVIREAVESCTVLVALIGRQWATIADEEGNRRLDNPDDYVRFEVQAALERDVRVIPVLVDGARPLQPQQLPPKLRKLARLNALELSYRRYEYDADRLLTLVQRVLDAAPRTSTRLPSSPAANVPVVADSHDLPYDSNAHLAGAERTVQSASQSDDPDPLIDLLYQDAVNIYERARREVTIPRKDGSRQKYAANRYKQQIDKAYVDYQLVPVIGRIVSRPTQGFGHLEEAGRDDLMVEMLVLDASKPYHRLFPEATVQMASERMAQYKARHPK